MSKKLKACLIALMFAVVPLSAAAENNDTVTGDKATDMVVDLVVVRPPGLAAMAIGTLLTAHNKGHPLGESPIRWDLAPRLPQQRI